MPNENVHSFTFQIFSYDLIWNIPSIHTYAYSLSQWHIHEFDGIFSQKFVNQSKFRDQLTHAMELIGHFGTNCVCIWCMQISVFHKHDKWMKWERETGIAFYVLQQFINVVAFKTLWCYAVEIMCWHFHICVQFFVIASRNNFVGFVARSSIMYTYKCCFVFVCVSGLGTPFCRC